LRSCPHNHAAEPVATPIKAGHQVRIGSARNCARRSQSSHSVHSGASTCTPRSSKPAWTTAPATVPAWIARTAAATSAARMKFWPGKRRAVATGPIARPVGAPPLKLPPPGNARRGLSLLCLRPRLRAGGRLVLGLAATARRGRGRRNGDRTEDQSAGNRQGRVRSEAIGTKAASVAVLALGQRDTSARSEHCDQQRACARPGNFLAQFHGKPLRRSSMDRWNDVGNPRGGNPKRLPFEKNGSA